MCVLPTALFGDDRWLRRMDVSGNGAMDASACRGLDVQQWYGASMFHEQQYVALLNSVSCQRYQRHVTSLLTWAAYQRYIALLNRVRYVIASFLNSVRFVVASLLNRLYLPSRCFL